MRDFAYASTIDVLAHLTVATTFTASSRPQATQVHRHLINASEEIDSALGLADYSTPVSTTATAAMQTLRHYTAIGAAMYSTAAHPSGEQSKHIDFLRERWTAILSGISDGEISLPGVGRDSSRSVPRFGGYAAGAEGASPYWTRVIDV